MENIYWCFGFVIGFAILCFGYAMIGLRKNNAYLRYSVGVIVTLHGCAQMYLVFGKYRTLLLQSDKFTYFQYGILIVGLILFGINVYADRYIIKQGRKKEQKYNFLDIDAMRMLATENNASRDIQDLLKYMTPRACSPEDEKIKELLLGLAEDNMESSYLELKKQINIREEKLKTQCK